MARLKDYYRQEVAPALMKKFSYKSPMQIPKIEKVTINIGCGDAKESASSTAEADGLYERSADETTTFLISEK